MNATLLGGPLDGTRVEVAGATDILCVPVFRDELGAITESAPAKPPTLTYDVAEYRRSKRPGVFRYDKTRTA